jgi:HK97 family phage prohead protease
MTGRRLELRQDSAGTTLDGYASVFNSPYTVGGIEEVVARGAFKRSLGNPGLDVQLLVNHAGLPLARTTSNTLHLTEDAVGLHVRAELDSSDPDVRSLAPKIRRGDLSEMSFAFRDLAPDWNADRTVRTLRQLDLHRGDVSVVSYGASPATSLALRHVKGLKGEFEERRVPIVLRGSDCNRCGGDGVITITCPNCGDADVESSRAASPQPRPSRPARRPSSRRVPVFTTTEWRAWLAAERARAEDEDGAHARWVEVELRKLRCRR